MQRDRLPAVSASVLFILGACTDPKEPTWVAIPRPLTVSVDDCGWQSGPSIAASGGPWRLGARDPILQDYQSLARIAQATGSRILTLWIMSELDRGNICGRAEYNMPDAPSDMTEQGLAWDNSSHVNDDNLALMSFMRDNAAWLEMGLHGVRHEHWEHGVRTRAEFGQSNGQGWGLTNSTVHLRCFAELIHQYFTPEVDPFPVSFAPPNHGYENNTDHFTTTGAAIASFGVRFAQRPGPTRFDNGVFVMDRDTSESPPWDATGHLPGAHPETKSWIMTHLPNYYDLEHPWIDWISALDAPIDHFVPKNSVVAASQLLYSEYARLQFRSDEIYIDTRYMADEAYALDLLGPIALKVKLGGQSSIAVTPDSDLQLFASYRDEYDHVVMMLGKRDQPRGRVPPGVFRVGLLLGQPQSGYWVDLQGGTFNVYSVTNVDAVQVVADVDVYGRQDMVLTLPGFYVTGVQSDNLNVAVLAWNWEPGAARLSMTVSGTNIQGERTHLIATSTTPAAPRLVPKQDRRKTR
jgi:hypothetical protein